MYRRKLRIGYESLFVLALAVSGWVGCKPAVKDDPAAGEAATALADDPAARIEVVQADVRKLQNAVFEGDLRTVIQFTHPKIIEELGGKEAAEEQMKEALSEAQMTGSELEVLTFPEDPTFFASPTHDFVFVPTLAVFKVNGLRIESLNFLLGAPSHCRPTAKWSYFPRFGNRRRASPRLVSRLSRGTSFSRNPHAEALGRHIFIPSKQIETRIHPRHGAQIGV